MQNDKRPAFRFLTPIHIALVVIVIISVVLIAASFLYTDSPTGEWLSSILLDVGFIMFGLAIAFVIGERLVIEAENHRWQEVDAAVCNRAYRAAVTSLGLFVRAPSIRPGIEAAHSGQIPTSAELLADLPFAVRWTEQTLLPAIEPFTLPLDEGDNQKERASLTRQDWNTIRSGASSAYALTSATVVLALPRDIPQLLSALLELETGLNALASGLAHGPDVATDYPAADEIATPWAGVDAVPRAALLVLRAIAEQDD